MGMGGVMGRGVRGKVGRVEGGMAGWEEGGMAGWEEGINGVMRVMACEEGGKMGLGAWVR